MLKVLSKILNVKFLKTESQRIQVIHNFNWWLGTNKKKIDETGSGMPSKTS